MSSPRARVLCVDDQTPVLMALARQLADNFEVVTARNAREALHHLAEQRPFQVIVTDQRLPGMQGLDLLKRAKLHWPQTTRVLAAASHELATLAGQAAEGDVFRYLVKPWQGEAPLRVVALAAEASLRGRGELLGERTLSPLMLALHHDDLPLLVDGEPIVPAPTLSPLALADGASEPGVLLLDDDDHTLTTVAEACAGRHPLVRVHTLAAALAQLRAQPSIGVVIAEVQFGNDRIPQLLEAIRREHPAVVTMLASGYANANLVIELINQGRIFRFIGKPFGATRVRELIGRAGVLHRSIRQSLAADSTAMPLHPAAHEHH
jgi:DNA-binding NtrC family response regulator